MRLSLVYILLLSDSDNAIPRKVAHGSSKSKLKPLRALRLDDLLAEGEHV